MAHEHKPRSFRERSKGLDKSDKAFESYKRIYPNSRLSFEKFQLGYYLLACTNYSFSEIVKICGSVLPTLRKINNLYEIRNRGEVSYIQREATANSIRIENRDNGKIKEGIVKDLEARLLIKDIAKKWGVDPLTVTRIRDKETSLTRDDTKIISYRARGKAKTEKHRKKHEKIIRMINEKTVLESGLEDYKYTLKEIANEFKLNKRTVHMLCSETPRTYEDNRRVMMRKILERKEIIKMAMELIKTTNFGIEEIYGEMRNRDIKNKKRLANHKCLYKKAIESARVLLGIREIPHTQKERESKKKNEKIDVQIITGAIHNFLERKYGLCFFGDGIAKDLSKIVLLERETKKIEKEIQEIQEKNRKKMYGVNILLQYQLDAKRNHLKNLKDKCVREYPEIRPAIHDNCLDSFIEVM